MRTLVVVGVLFCVAGVAVAQDLPKAEIFTGYSYGNFSILSDRSSLNGWNASATVNFYRWFGLTTDFGGLYGGSATETQPPPVSITETLNQKFHTFLFGPQVAYHRGRVSVFAHFLVGETLVSEHLVNLCTGVTCLATFNSRSSSGTALPGGGLDYAFGRNLAWRVQADYLPLGVTNDVRVSTGLVFRIGKHD